MMNALHYKIFKPLEPSKLSSQPDLDNIKVAKNKVPI